jgi:hypothetical protein
MVYTFAAGEQPTADALNAIFDVSMIRKAASESVTSSTVVQDDDDFSIELDPGTYIVWLWCHVSGASNGDFKCLWANTGTMTIGRSCNGPTVGTTDRNATAVCMYGTGSGTAVTYGNDGSGTATVREELMVIVDVVGTLKFQWAQGTSSATATTLSTASRMLVMSVA